VVGEAPSQLLQQRVAGPRVHCALDPRVHVRAHNDVLVCVGTDLCTQLCICLFLKL